MLTFTSLGDVTSDYNTCWSQCLDAWQACGSSDACQDALITCRRQCLVNSGCSSDFCEGASSLFAAAVDFFKTPSPFSKCVDNCNNTYSDPAQNDACFKTCMAAPGGPDRYGGTDFTSTLPGGATPTTYGNLPSQLAPAGGYQAPQAQINWYRVGGAALLGVLALGGILYFRRGTHAA